MTPSQAIVNAAHTVFEVTDARGRVLALRRPTTLDRLRLFKAAGPLLSQNDRWLGLAMLAFTVSTIDGVPYPQPSNEHQIETALERLGDDGVNAIGGALSPEDTEGLAVAAAGN